MGWTLAAAQADSSFAAVPLILGLVLLALGYVFAKTGVITRDRDYLSRSQRYRSAEWFSGYQGDEPTPGINRDSDPFTFEYIVLGMYFFGALLILTAIVGMLFPNLGVF
jgi:hypothetical protein